MIHSSCGLLTADFTFQNVKMQCDTCFNKRQRLKLAYVLAEMEEIHPSLITFWEVHSQ